MSNKHANPIEYVLNSLKEGKKIQKFDILNALAEWDSIKNNNPVSYGLDDSDNIHYIKDNPYVDRRIVKPLYKHYKDR